MAIYIKAFILLPLLFVSCYARHKPLDIGFDDNDDDSSVGINNDDSDPKSVKQLLKHLDGKINKHKKSKKKHKKHDDLEVTVPELNRIHVEQQQIQEAAQLGAAGVAQQQNQEAGQLVYTGGAEQKQNQDDGQLVYGGGAKQKQNQEYAGGAEQKQNQEDVKVVYTSAEQKQNQDDGQLAYTGGAEEKGKKCNNPKPDFETEYLGNWMIHTQNAGVSAMHIQLMPNNKAVWFDTTNLGPSAIQHNPPFCKPIPDRPGETDCWAHGVQYDIESGQARTLKIMTDTWCSSGGLSSTGDLISTGGFREGIRSIRIMNPCDNCEFQENANGLAAMRWYATQHMLENGSFILVGGRGAHNYEIIPPGRLQFQVQQFGLNFLAETEDEKENNLYPFVNLLPDGNVFIFANDRSIIIDPYSGKILRELPKLPGGSRNYPASGMSALLPINLNTPKPEDVEVEVIVCGGNTHDAFKYSENPPRLFFPALKDCGRIFPNKKDAQWDIEDMPTPRVMGDMLLLPTGDILITNGAKTGTSAWDAAEEPNLVPVLYSPTKPKGQRFKELTPTQIPRMYHSTSAVLPDGKILVAGSNTHALYDFQAKYPTDLRVEKFIPPYLAPGLEKHKPQIVEVGANKEMRYGQDFNINIKLDEVVDETDIRVTMYAPPFTTHGYSQGQRLLILQLKAATNQQVTVVAPPSGKLAPPGYYLLFVVHRGVPSRGMWVHIDK